MGGILAENEEKPAIKRYVLKINLSGDIIETIDLDEKQNKEKEDILSIVILQGLTRLGYRHL